MDREIKKIICLIEHINSGGAERQLCGLATMLKQSGHEVEVWTYYPGNFYAYQLDEASVKFRYLNYANNKFIRIFYIIKELKKAKADTLIAYLDTACIIACIAKIIFHKINVIVSERNTTQTLSLKQKIKFNLYKFANHIVPNSYTQTNFIANNYPTLSKKLKCITNFVDTEKFCPLSKSLYKRGMQIKILTVARVMPQKNTINYIKAIKNLVNEGYKIEVNWYGYNGDSYFKSCIEIINSLDLTDIFKFHNPNKNIHEIYNSHDIFCLPSFYEGFPNVVCEAMSCGLPIVCSDICDNKYIVRDRINGLLFNPYDIKDISDKLIECINNLYEKDYKNSNRQWALQLFSKKLFIDKYLEII